MLDKYLAAAKGIAAHAVLLPDGFRFSEKTTRPDWTEEILTEIKAIYRRYTNPGGSTQVKLQGLVWDSKGGGLIPLENYLAATIAYRDGGPRRKSLEAIAAENHLSAKYLQTLWEMLDGPGALAPARPRSRALAMRPGPRMSPRWPPRFASGKAHSRRFGSVGHFKPWQETGEPARGVAGVPPQAGTGSGCLGGRAPARDAATPATAPPAISSNGRSRDWNRRDVRRSCSATCARA